MDLLVDERVGAYQFLHDLDAPPSPGMLKAAVAWKRGESGTHIARNNPLNIRFFSGEPGFVHMEGGFSLFSSYMNGWKAAAIGLLEFPAGDFRHYAEVVAAARADNPVVFLKALAASSWDAGKYGTLHGGPNKLVEIFDHELGSYTNDVVTPGPIGEVMGANVAVKETFDPAREFTVHAGTTVTGYDTQGPVKGASWDKDSNAHANELVELTQAINPEQAPHGEFLHVVDGVYAGLYIPAGEVTVTDAPNPAPEPAPEPVPAPIPVPEPVPAPAPAPAPAPEPTPAPAPDCSDQVAEAIAQGAADVAANEAKWVAWLMQNPRS